MTSPMPEQPVEARRTLSANCEAGDHDDCAAMVENPNSLDRCECPCGHPPDDPRETKVRKDFDDAAEAVHRAFCEPDHEKVSRWDQDMADALRRRGLVITRAARASVALDGAAIRRAIDEACSLTNPRLSEVEWDAVAARLTDPSR
jgi:hypothetical protein